MSTTALCHCAPGCDDFQVLAHDPAHGDLLRCTHCGEQLTERELLQFTAELATVEEHELDHYGLGLEVLEGLTGG